MPIRSCPALVSLLLLAGCATMAPNPLSRYEPPSPLPAQTAPAAEARTVYVSPAGNDEWSGTLPTPNGDGSDGPLRTIAAAQTLVRTLRTKTANPPPMTVFLRQGVYKLARPLVFTPEDSGTEDSPILYRPYGDEDVAISGGVSVTEWTREGELLTASLPEGVDAEFHRLYVNGYRRPLARTPDEHNYVRIQRANGLWVEPDGTSTDVGTKRSFMFREGDVPQLTDYTGVNVVVLRNWESAILPVEAVDFDRGAILFKGEMKWELRKDLRYYLQGYRDALDAPGEWWCDRQNRKLYYKPFRGEAAGNLRAAVPQLTELVLMKGDPEAGLFVEHIAFEGITFENTDYDLPATGHSDWQAAVTVPAAIQADGARNIEIRRCVVRSIGQYAIWFRRGCADNKVEQTEVYDVGAGGIRIGESGIRKAEADRTHSNTIHNCFIHDGSSVFYGAIPIWIGQSSDNTVTHNEVCDFNYTGISVGWSWGFHPTTCHRNEIAYNHLHHLGRGVLYDMAAIYTLGISTGTRIHHNLIHHIWGYVEGYGAGGIYPDEGSSGLLIENNVVYLTQNGGLTVHYGRDNIARNNVFAFGQRSQIHLGRKDKDSSQTLLNNIVIYREGALFHRLSDLTCDKNVYWNTQGEQPEFPGGLTFAEWQKEGYDRHSVVADPRFRNADKWDFTLSPDSPAIALGFKPIDISTAGLLGNTDWTARPKRVGRPEMKELPRKPVKPPTPVFDDFETAAIGALPDFATPYGIKDTPASIAVTDECAAGGKHSLKIVDAPGMEHTYNPHLYFRPGFREGTVKGSFDVRLEPGAVFTHEWRTDGTPFVPGPSLTATAGGPFLAGGQTVLETVPVNAWIHVELICRVGKKANGNYSILVQPAGEKPVRKTVACNPKFTAADWCVFVSDADQHTVIYLDNVNMKMTGR